MIVATVLVLLLALGLGAVIVGACLDEAKDSRKATAHETDGRPAKPMRIRLRKIRQQNWND